MLIEIFFVTFDYQVIRAMSQCSLTSLINTVSTTVENGAMAELDACKYVLQM